MFTGYSDKSFAYLAFAYEPRPGFALALPRAFEAVQEKSRKKFTAWIVTSDGRYILRCIERRYVVFIEHSRLAFFGLGLDAFVNERKTLVGLFNHALDVMKIDALKRLGFQVVSFVPTGMSHAEICDLMFGGFLLDARNFSDICGKPDDVLIDLHGRQDGLKSRTIIGAMTSEQVSSQIMKTANVELLLEPRYFDATLLEFRDRCAIDCLLVDNDLSDEDKPTSEIDGFVEKALATSSRMIESVQYKLKSLRRKEAD